MQPWEVLEERCVYRNKHWLTVHEHRVRLPNGRIIEDYLVTEVPEVVMVFAITADGEVLLVEQYRHGTGRDLLDLVAGYIDAGEDPLAAAQRELEEETGYCGGRWTSLGALYYGPSRHDSRFHFFLAEGVVPEGRQHFDDTEELRMQRVPLSEITRYIREGDICGVYSVAGIYRALDALGASPPLADGGK